MKEYKCSNSSNELNCKSLVKETSRCKSKSECFLKVEIEEMNPQKLQEIQNEIEENEDMLKRMEHEYCVTSGDYEIVKSMVSERNKDLVKERELLR